jgi:mono/diheme cytochrome c family protein
MVHDYACSGPEHDRKRKRKAEASAREPATAGREAVNSRKRNAEAVATPAVAVWLPLTAGQRFRSRARFRLPLTAVTIALAVTSAPAQAQAQSVPGKATYDKWCAECHGETGRGDGSAAGHMLPRPRDFTQARFQVRTTPSGALPTDADIMAVLDNGMPGTAMPAWPKLSTREKNDVVAYLKTFSRFFETEPTPVPLEIARAPRASAERIASGREVYEQVECWKCHGAEGRGDGPSAPTQEDDNEHPIRPANLAQNWRFNGGGSVADIYTRLRTGLDGTPMPAFSDLLDSNIITDDQLWDVALFVRSLSPERPPEPREVIRAHLSAGDLPAGPADEAWQNVEAAYVPLVGQIIASPRWFAPTVNAVWVQALHNGSELALRLTWDDPSHSPDPAWEEWRTKITAAMEPQDAAPAAGAPADALTLQFSPAPMGGQDLPYFLNGDTKSPVYLWEWQSDGGVREALARGIDTREPLPADGAPVHADASYADGQWQLVLRRTLAAQDTARRTTFRTAEALPIAFFAWDGSNGESGTRGAVSSWYFIYLEQPVTAGVYVTPIIAAALAALFGILVVTRAQKEHRRAAASTDGP